MTEDQNKILSRVRKMLAIANDSAATEAERDTALQMAYKVLAKHNLDMAQVDAHGNAQAQEPREEQEAKFVVYPWARSIAHTVGDLFFCSYFFVRSWQGKQAKHVFLGRQSNAVTAAYMSEYIVKSVLREAAKRYGSATSPEARQFAVGVVSKLRQRVAALKVEQAADMAPAQGSTGVRSTGAMVLASLYESEKKANELMLAKAHPDLKEVKSTTKGVNDMNAYRAGQAHGASISLAPQVGGSSKAKFAALK